MLTTRFFTQRLDKQFDRADQALTGYALKQFQEAADKSAQVWSKAIKASGRGGSHNSEMANIQAKVTQPKRGGFFVRIGWLSGAPQAADGKTTWYVYQDAGYDPFGMIARGIPASRVPGLFAQIDAREKSKNYFEDAADAIKAEVARAFRS